MQNIFFKLLRRNNIPDFFILIESNALITETDKTYMKFFDD